ncbi:MAG: ISAzo13 family transposase [Gammaproteobacteria bacterium]
MRREGGGRNAADKQFKNIDEVFISVITEYIAGDPMDEKVKWIKLTRYQISIKMKEFGVHVSRNIVRKLLKKHGFVKRKIQRKKTTGEFKDREQQFANIKKIKRIFMESNNPILSVDTKKKEKLGNLYRAGEVYCTKAIESYDHDYNHLAQGSIVPHGVYDLKRNEALINIGLNHETANSVCDSILAWWNKAGKIHYSNATEILIFCDSGGANSYRHNLFKIELQNLANIIGLPIRICHYPPYASKWNPIEHRVFPHVTRAMAGVKLTTINDAKKLIAQTETKTGLKVLVDITKKIYKTGITAAKEALSKINLKTHGRLALNYTVAPVVT